jgi:hypothetical protein
LDLAFAYYCLSVPQRAMGDPAAALRSLDQGIANCDAMSAVDPNNLTAVAHLDSFLRVRFELCTALGDSIGRRESARRWAACAARLVAANPRDEAQSADLGRARAAADEAAAEAASP